MGEGMKNMNLQNLKRNQTQSEKNENIENKTILLENNNVFNKETKENHIIINEFRDWIEDVVCNLLPQGAMIGISLREESSGYFRIRLKTKVGKKNIVSSVMGRSLDSIIQKSSSMFKKKIIKEKSKKIDKRRKQDKTGVYFDIAA